jgi:hypothetical protein
MVVARGIYRPDCKERGPNCRWQVSFRSLEDPFLGRCWLVLKLGAQPHHEELVEDLILVAQWDCWRWFGGTESSLSFLAAVCVSGGLVSPSQVCEE